MLSHSNSRESLHKLEELELDRNRRPNIQVINDTDLNAYEEILKKPCQITHQQIEVFHESL